MVANYSNIILTGATGWLGRRIALALTKGIKEFGVIGEGGCKITCLLENGESSKELVDLGAKIICGNISQQHVCDKLFDDNEGSLVIHTAGIIHPKLFVSDLMKINYLGTKNLFNSAIKYKAKRIIAISSNSPFGFNKSSKDIFTETSPYDPYMTYGKSKKLMEDYILQLMIKNDSPDITILRPTWFYGPGQPPRQTQFFRMVKNGKFPLMGDGLNRRSMSYVDSLAYAILLSSKSQRAANQVYWIADKKPYSMIEIVNTIKDILKNDFSIKVNDKNLFLPSFISDVSRLVDGTLQLCGLYNQKFHVLSEMNQTIACSIEKAQKDFKYRPIYDLREGMTKSISWCLDNNQMI